MKEEQQEWRETKPLHIKEEEEQLDGLEENETTSSFNIVPVKSEDEEEEEEKPQPSQLHHRQKRHMEIRANGADSRRGIKNKKSYTAPVKVKVSWTSEMEDLLVDLWQQHECLYNISSKNYHNKTEKEKSWTEIATAMEVPVEEVKTRATTLRTQYSKLLKSKPSGNGEKPLTSKQKWLLKGLMFLKRHVIQRSTESSLNQSVKEALAAEDPTSDESATSEDFTVGVSAGASQPTTSLSDDDVEESVAPSTQTKKRKKTQNANSIERQKIQILQQMSAAFLSSRNKPATDSDATFGAQVAEELRAIKNAAIKTRVKRKIMNDLYEAQECDLSYVMPPPPTTNHQPPDGEEEQ